MKIRVSNCGLWSQTAPEAPTTSVFEGRRHADVAVIGGGYTGLSAALHLARSGADVAVLEAREIGFGGSGRNVGLVNAGLWMFPDDVVKALGPDRGERALSILGEAPDLVYSLIAEHNINCEAVREGTLHCAHSRGGYRALRTRMEQWGRRGVHLRLMEADAAAPEIGSQAFYGALLDMRAGTLQPLAYAYGLARAAMLAGASMFTQSPVAGLERVNRRWEVKTPDGVLSATAVIVAGGGYINGVRRALDQTFIPFNYFQFSTPPLPESIRKTILPGGRGAWDTALVLSSFRLDASGRLIVGSVGKADHLALTLHRQWAGHTLRRVFPQLGQIRFAHAWHGRIAMTPDHIPRFFILGDNLAMVTNYNGRGIGPGTVFGKLMADFILNGDPDIIPLPVSTAKPIPLRGLMGWCYEAGARLHHLTRQRF